MEVCLIMYICTCFDLSIHMIYSILFLFYFLFLLYYYLSPSIVPLVVLGYSSYDIQCDTRQKWMWENYYYEWPCY